MPSPDSVFRASDDPAEASAFFVRLVAGYRSAKVVFTASALGIFDALAAGPQTEDEVATSLGTELRATRLLLRALAALGLTRCEEGRFANTPFAQQTLVRSAPRYVGNNIAFQELIWPSWSELEATVRSGRPKSTLGALLGAQDSTFTREYIRGMDNIAKAPAREVARLLGGPEVQRILDVGGGPGTFSLALLEACPNATATLLDLPTTLDVAREVTAASPCRDRLSFEAADYLRDDFGSGYDLVLMSHVTHDESPEGTRAMCRRAFAALAPGGRLAVHDFLTTEDGCGPLFSALFSINMLVYTEGGQTYSRGEYERFLAEAGFVALEHHAVLEHAVANPTGLIVGTKGVEPR